MQFVVNTSFDPHFCALFDENNQLIQTSFWDTPRQDGQKIWEFLHQHVPPKAQLNFIGGISGPGSFSSLRSSSATLNALAFKYQIPIHQARADQVINDFLAQKNRVEPYLLNSFSQRVFWPQKGDLTIYDLSQNPLPNSTSFITSWLPEAKAKAIPSAPAVDPKGPIETILQSLKNTQPQTQFVPDYEYPPVQS